MDAFEELKQRVEENRRCYAAGEIPAPAERRRQLRRMLQWLRSEQGRVLNALDSDLHKCETEARLSEIFPLIGALKHLIRRLPRLTRDRRVPTPLFCFPASGYLRAEPYGQVLIFGTWTQINLCLHTDIQLCCLMKLLTKMVNLFLRAQVVIILHMA